jgi:hypothetical protein
MDSSVYSVLFAGLFLASCVLFLIFNALMAKYLKSYIDGFEVMNRINTEVNGRVNERVKVINRGTLDGGAAVSNIPNLPPGMLHSYGSDILVEEQPPVTTSSIKTEADEIVREMTRFRDPRNDYDKRDNWNDGIEEA